MQTGIDCAWRTRVTSFYSGAEAAAIIARGQCREPIVDERAAELEAFRAKAAEAEAKAIARPFDFADLNGAPEPAKWGPLYPKTASQAVTKWRMVSNGRELSEAEKREYGQAVGAWIRGLNAAPRANYVSTKSTEFCAARHRAQLRAAFAAKAEADKRAWALGQSKNERGETIAQAYERAMAEKAARLADPIAYARKLEREAEAVRAFNAKVEAERDRLAKRRAQGRVTRSRPRKAAKQREAA